MLKKLLPDLSLVIGGAASGKSEFAENLVMSGGSAWTYIATSRVLDSEMQSKVDRHAARRGAGWTVVEAPDHATRALRDPGGDRPVLFDCATMWLSNVMMDDRDLKVEQAALLDALAACPAPVVVVTNETGQGIVPDNALARHFRESQGRLNIALARQSGLVVQVVAGLPNVLKGTLP